jgi:hypothetical protein
MNIKAIDNRFSPSQTKAEKLQELNALLNELFALKEKLGEQIRVQIHKGENR